MTTSIIMPQLGESVVDGTITKWLKNEGDQVQEFEPLLEVETVKVTSEIPSPASGVLLKIVVPEGKTVLARTVLGWIGNQDDEIPDQPGSSNKDRKEGKRDTLAELEQPRTSEQKQSLGFISPIVNKLAKEHQVDLSKITGTGENGRITKKDVLSYLEKATTSLANSQETPAWETPGSGDLFKPTGMLMPDPKQKQYQKSQISNTEKTGMKVIPLTSTRKAIADHMIFSMRTSAHVTSVMEVDLSGVIKHRSENQHLFQKENVRLTYTPYFLIAVAHALLKYPVVNSSLTEQGLLYHPEINIGMAVSLGEEGLIVPVIHQADGLSLMGMARKVNDLANRARNHKLTPDEVTGGTFSVTNHGTGGSLFATPIINQPQVGILGVGMVQKRAVVVQDAIAIRPMVYLSLTFDHRIIDGSTADGFLTEVISQLQK